MLRGDVVKPGTHLELTDHELFILLALNRVEQVSGDGPQSLSTNDPVSSEEVPGKDLEPEATASKPKRSYRKKVG